MAEQVLVDTGPLVALLDADDQHHEWARERFKELPGPLWTCEAVVAETVYLLRRLQPAQDAVLAWICRGALKIPFSIENEAKAVRALLERYRNIPMSLADACLVRMAEVHTGSRICTIDSDFAVYRKNGKQPLVLITPTG